MTKVRAIFVVTTGTGRVVPTGKLDSDGRVLYASESFDHRPGAVFEIEDPVLLRRLLFDEAIEVLDDGYDDLIAEATEASRAERGIVRNTSSPEPEVWPKPAFPHEAWTDAPAIRTPKFEN